MDYVTILEAIATILCVIGVVYGAIPRRIGIYYLIVGTICWIAFAYFLKRWFLFSEEFFLLIINFICLKTWKNQGIPF
jgi:hypothetical protein